MAFTHLVAVPDREMWWACARTLKPGVGPVPPLGQEQDDWISDRLSFGVAGDLAQARDNIIAGTPDALAGLTLSDIRFAAEARAQEPSGALSDAVIQAGLDAIVLPANRPPWAIDWIRGGGEWGDGSVFMLEIVDKLLQLGLWGSIVREPF